MPSRDSLERIGLTTDADAEAAFHVSAEGHREYPAVTSRSAAMERFRR